MSTDCQIASLRIVQVTVLGISARSFLIEHFVRLRARGAEVILICSEDEDARAAAAAARIRFEPVKIRQYIAPWSDLVSLVRLVRLFRRHRPQVVHAHMTKAALLGILAGWLAGVRVRIYHNHGLAFVSASGFRRRILLVAEWITHRLATHSLFCSESTRGEAVKAGVVSPDRAEVLGKGTISGVDVSTFRPGQGTAERQEQRRAWGVDDDTVVVGYVGRLLAEKGIEELMQAWRRLDPPVRARARLIMIGGDARGEPKMQSVVEKAAADGIGVQALGWMANMASCYAAMDVLVLPSWREGFPYSVLEAQSCGIPVIATRTTGCVDAVEHEVTGLLVPLRRPDALAHALTRLISSPDERKRLGDQARQRILAEYTQDNVLGHMVRFYEERVAPLAKA